jgi:hypothetical protein
MPLITLLNETKLKSLGYGNDRPDGASSNQPYIQTPIPEGREVNSPDFLLRNGYLNAINSAQDVSRLTKYFIDTKSPNGILFTAKQELLERQNVNVSDGINRLYNPLGTIAQAGVLSTGYHLNKQGFNIFREGYYNGGKIGYFTITNTSNTLGEDRLSLLFKSKISNSANEFEILAGKNLYGITPSLDTVNLLSYSGGPGSTLGIGNTNIKLLNGTRPVENISEQNKFQPSYYSTLISDPKYLVVNNGFRPSINWKYNPRIENPGVSNAFIFQQNLEENQTSFYPDNSADSLLNRKDIPASSVDTNNNIYLFDYNQSFSQESKFTYKSTALVGIKDFRQTINNNKGENVIPSTDYSRFNREDTYDNSKTTYKGNYNYTSGNYVLDPNEAISPDQTEIGETGEDIIDFNFTIINNTGLYSPSDPENINRLIDFKAYIEQWNDRVGGEWSGIKYMGRAEQLYKYNGFSRDADVTFLIPALSRADMISNYRKLNALIWAVSPSYSSTEEGAVAGLMRGSITNVTIGDYFRRMPSIIKNISISEIEGMGWDINRNQDGTIIENKNSNTNYVGQLPKGIRVQLSFTPLHNFVPQYGEAFVGQNDRYVPPSYGKPVWRDTTDQQSNTSGYYLK